MSLPIISAQQRMTERKGVKLLMLGKSGIGKTTRLKDLDPATTLFLDIEAGDLAVAMRPRTAATRSWAARSSRRTAYPAIGSPAPSGCDERPTRDCPRRRSRSDSSCETSRASPSICPARSS